MFTNKLSENAQKVLDVIGNVLPENTYLAGGTGLAMHLDHRESYDLDLYNDQEFNLDEIIQRFEITIPDFELISRSWQTIVGKSKDTEISLFFYKYKLLEGTIKFKSIQVASIPDIAAMKIEALVSRGLKRDFFDIYSICKIKNLDLINILELNQQKYERKQSDFPHILKSLTYFVDAETKPERAQIIDSEWEKVKEFFVEETQKLIEGQLVN